MIEEREEIEIDLLDLLKALKKKILIIILVAVIGAAGAGAYSFLVAKPVYESTASIYVLTQSTSITSLADIQASSSLALDYIELIKSRPVVEDVIEDCGLDLEYEEMLEKLTVANPADTRIIEISIQDGDRGVATRVANSFSTISRKQISDIMQTDEPTVVEVAQRPDDPIKPEKKKNIAIGFILGALLASIVIAVMHILNDHIRSEDEIERYLGLNTLASIPVAGKHKKKSSKHKKKSSKRKKK